MMKIRYRRRQATYVRRLLIAGVVSAPVYGLVIAALADEWPTYSPAVVLVGLLGMGVGIVMAYVWAYLWERQ